MENRKKKNDKFHEKGEANVNAHNKPKFQHDVIFERSDSEKPGRSGNKSCHLCGSDKHLMADCDNRKASNTTYQNKKPQVQCYKCKQSGHKANACDSSSNCMH
jgi:hypothetical protein